MSETHRRYELIIDQLVGGDLTRLAEEDRYAHRQIIVFLEELSGDLRLCEELIDEHHSDGAIQSVEPFWFMQQQRLNVYRIKLYLIGKWRILSAGDHRRRQVAILAIMHRDQDYQNDAALILRLKDCYERLGFSELGRK